MAIAATQFIQRIVADRGMILLGSLTFTLKAAILDGLQAWIFGNPNHPLSFAFRDITTFNPLHTLRHTSSH